jgi:hypothetical protein
LQDALDRKGIVSIDPKCKPGFVVRQACWISIPKELEIFVEPGILSESAVVDESAIVDMAPQAYAPKVRARYGRVSALWGGSQSGASGTQNDEAGRDPCHPMRVMLHDG